MLTVSIRGVEMRLNTGPALFSPNAIDDGTAAMLSCVEFGENEKVLDLGCGYGAAGIYAAKIIGARNVTMLDIDAGAVETAAQNAELNGVPEITAVVSDGFKSLDDTGFTMILSNPPYHTDFSTAKHFIEKGFNRLTIGGRLFMVTKRRDWYKNKLVSIFGGVSIREINGYYVFAAEKRAFKYNNRRNI